MRQVRIEPEAVVELLVESEMLAAALLAENSKLKERLALDRTNSSKPHSGDGCKKASVRNLREKGARKPGGQPGHPSHTMEPVKNPDHKQVHTLHTCPCGQCGGVSLENEPVLDHECVASLREQAATLCEDMPKASATERPVACIKRPQ